MNFLVIWLLNASLVPGINESHYLPKAKHAWDETFAPGDLFLASGNAHWLFAQIAGFMSTWLPLAAVAWIGRVTSWLCMAFAWHRCASSLRFSTLVAPLVLAGWIVAVRLGNWAGEWAVGGFEAKALAYPFVMLALAELILGKWARVWWLVGIAIALHPLVGGWAGVTFAAAWLGFGRQVSPLKTQLLPGLIGAAISSIGVLPALSMIGGPSRSGDIVVAQIHAFYRLAHHQSPRLFHTSQHFAGAISLLLLIVASALIMRMRVSVGQTKPVDQGELANWRSAQLIPLRRLLCIAWLAVAVSMIGLLVDLIGVQLRPDIAASLLRFYWFRWSDVIVPLAWICGMWSFALALLHAGEHDRASGPGVNFGNQRAIFTLTVLVLATIGFVGDQVIKQWRIEIAPADQTVLMSGNSDLASGPEVVLDWQAVCAWVADNTATDALFFTPRAQQTFKWYAGRAEVVSFKDVPQDSRSLLEWYDRIGRCAPPRDAMGRPRGWSTAQLKRLHARYRFQYAIVDRRIQREPPLLEMVYPVNMGHNATFAVFKLPDIRGQ